MTLGEPQLRLISSVLNEVQAELRDGNGTMWAENVRLSAKLVDDALHAAPQPPDDHGAKSGGHPAAVAAPTPLTDAVLSRGESLGLSEQWRLIVKHAKHMERRGGMFKEAMHSYEQAARSEKERAERLESALRNVETALKFRVRTIHRRSDGKPLIEIVQEALANGSDATGGENK